MPRAPSPRETRGRWLAFVNDNDRNEIFTETATVATSAGPAYWLVLFKR